MAHADTTPIIEAVGLRKRFGEVQALDAVRQPDQMRRLIGLARWRRVPTGC
jgi:hypothetical protein